MPIIKFKKENLNNLSKIKQNYNVEFEDIDFIDLELPSNRIDLLVYYFLNLQMDPKIEEKTKTFFSPFREIYRVSFKKVLDFNILNFLKNLEKKYSKEKKFEYNLKIESLEFKYINFIEKEIILINNIIFSLCAHLAKDFNFLYNNSPIIITIDSQILKRKLKYYDLSLKDINPNIQINLNQASLPFYRLDIQDEDDIIEDTLILRGYKYIKKLPLKIHHTKEFQINDILYYLRNVLMLNELDEVYLKKLIPENYIGEKVKNPYSANRAIYDSNFENSVKIYADYYCTSNFFLAYLAKTNKIISYIVVDEKKMANVLNNIIYWAFLKNYKIIHKKEQMFKKFFIIIELEI